MDWGWVSGVVVVWVVRGIHAEVHLNILKLLRGTKYSFDYPIFSSSNRVPQLRSAHLQADNVVCSELKILRYIYTYSDVRLGIS